MKAEATPEAQRFAPLKAAFGFDDVISRFRIDVDQLHPIASLIVERTRTRDRSDGHRLGLVVEGGAMRGIVSLGMLVFLEQMGATDVFDDIYGSSAGAINAAFFMGGQAGMAATVYYNEMLTRGFIDFRRHLKGEPIVSTQYLLDEVVESEKPLDWNGVVAASTRFHPIAYSTTRHETLDLAPIETKTELREALRASARVPIVAGDAVPYKGDTYFDASLRSSIPYDHALADGCTHLLVLRSRPRSVFRAKPSWIERRITEPRLRKMDPALLAVFQERAARYRAEVEGLEALEGPTILHIAPADEDPVVSSFARSQPSVLGGAASGMRAASRGLLGVECRPLEELRAFYA